MNRNVMSLIRNVENKNTEIFNRIFIEMETMKMEIYRLKTQLIFQDSIINTLIKENGEQCEDESSISTNIGNVIDILDDQNEMEFDFEEPVNREPLSLDDLENGNIKIKSFVNPTEYDDFDEYCNKSRIFSMKPTEIFDEENQIPEPLPLVRQTNRIERQFSPFVLETIQNTEMMDISAVDFSNLQPFTLEELIAAGYVNQTNQNTEVKDISRTGDFPSLKSFTLEELIAAGYDA